MSKATRQKRFDSLEIGELVYFHVSENTEQMNVRKCYIGAGIIKEKFKKKSFVEILVPYSEDIYRLDVDWFWKSPKDLIDAHVARGGWYTKNGWKHVYLSAADMETVLYEVSSRA